MSRPCERDRDGVQRCANRGARAVARLGPRPRGRSLRRALLGSYFRPI